MAVDLEVSIATEATVASESESESAAYLAGKDDVEAGEGKDVAVAGLGRICARVVGGVLR